MLERIQFAAIRRALGFRLSTPTNILIGESKLPLLKERAKYLCKRFLLKSLSNTSTQTFHTIMWFRNSLEKN